MRWRPKLRIYGLVTGAVGGLGAVVLLAQYGISPVTTRALSLRGLLGGLGSGLALPSAIFALVVWRFNRKLARLGLHPGRQGGQAPRPAPAAVLLIVALPAVFAILSAVRPASAEVTGPCTANFAGVDAAGATTSAGDAIEVPEDGAVTYAMAAPEDLESWVFWLQYGPFRQDIAVGDKDEPDTFDLGLGLEEDDDFVIDFEGLLGSPIVEGNSIRGAVATSDYAWLGAGLYEVHGSVVTVGGTPCSGVILIDVEGDPLGTVAGAAAAGATAIGVAGAAAVALGGLRDGGEVLDRLEELPEGIDIDGDGIVDVPFDGPVDLDGDGVADTIDWTQPVLVDEDGNIVPINDRGEAFTWDQDGWRWMPREEAEGLIDAQIEADADRVAEQAIFVAETQAVLDAWLADRVQTNEEQARAERQAREQMQEAWERYDRMHDAALANDMYDVLERLSEDETIFDRDGNLDVDYLDRMQTVIRNRQRWDQLAPDPTYSEWGETIMAVDEVSQHTAVRIVAGMATGGVSEIWYQGRGVVEAVAEAAGDSTEWVQDPQTGEWVPPSEIGVLGGIRVAADRIAAENVPGYGTIQTLGDPDATWGDVASAAAWDAIGAQLARGEIDEAIGQITGSVPGGRVRLDVPDVDGIRGVGSAADVPTIKVDAGDVVAPPPYTDSFLPQFRQGQEGLQGLRTGDAIPNDMLHQTGLTGRQIDELQNFANTHQVGVDVRAINPDSMRHIQSGAAVPKPLDLKPKTLKIEDYYLGACELDDVGKVGFYDPSKVSPRPIPSDAPADLAQRIADARETRAREFSTYHDDVEAFLGGDISARSDGAVLTTPDGRAYAGDIDGVRFTDPQTGQPITDPQRYEELKEAWTTQSPDTGTSLGEHGMESHVPSDIVDSHFDNAPRGEPLSADEFVQAQNQAWESGQNLQDRLIQNRVDGSDLVVSVQPGGTGLTMGEAVTSDELRQLGESLY